jgi:hypothetical protein
MYVGMNFAALFWSYHPLASTVPNDKVAVFQTEAFSKGCISNLLITDFAHSVCNFGNQKTHPPETVNEKNI